MSGFRCWGHSQKTHLFDRFTFISRSRGIHAHEQVACRVNFGKTHQNLLTLQARRSYGAAAVNRPRTEKLQILDVVLLTSTLWEMLDS